MCIGNTTSPAATNTTNVSWGDAWERPEVINPGPTVSGTGSQPKKSSLKTPSKSQSSRTSGGAY